MAKTKVTSSQRSLAPVRKQRKASRYRSKFEGRVALQLRRAAFLYEPREPRITYVDEHTYVPDFVLPNGVLIEAKGYFKSADRTKHLKLKKQRPDLDIRFCFQRASTLLSPRSKNSYSAWADKHGFRWCERVIPNSWLISNNKNTRQHKGNDSKDN